MLQSAGYIDSKISLGSNHIEAFLDFNIKPISSNSPNLLIPSIIPTFQLRDPTRVEFFKDRHTQFELNHTIRENDGLQMIEEIDQILF